MKKPNRKLFFTMILISALSFSIGANAQSLEGFLDALNTTSKNQGKETPEKRGKVLEGNCKIFLAALNPMLISQGIKPKTFQAVLV